MGRPKPLLDFDGRSCLELALDAARAAKLARASVVLRHQADALRKQVKLDAATVVVNADFEQGQSSWLKIGLKALPRDASAFLLHPVDCPLVTAGDIQALVKQWNRPKRTKQIFIPSCNLKRGHPVLFDAALKKEFLAL